MKTALYPGTFDPVTNGHADIIKRAAALCDRLIVAVMINPDKNTAFTVQERVDMLKCICSGMPGVEVVQSEGLLVDLARACTADFVVRGVRGAADLELETAMASANRRLMPTLDTVLLPASPDHLGVSSSLVRQLSHFGADIDSFVPPCTAQAIRRVYHKQYKNGGNENGQK
jgi:pantetheine-phosphate adenylyltransferase